MDASSLSLISNILKVMAGLFAIGAALLGYFEVAQNKNYEPVKMWFRNKWISVSETRWPIMAEKVIREGLDLVHSLASWLADRFEDPVSFRYILVACGVSVVVGSWIRGGPYVAAGAFLSYCSVLWVALADRDVVMLGRHWILGTLFVAYLGLGLSLPAIVWLPILLDVNIAFAGLVALLLIPVYSFGVIILIMAVWVFLEYIGKTVSDDAGAKVKRNEMLVLFGSGVSASFTVTLLALFLGHIADPTAWIPQTYQMLFSNVFFDGVTLVATIYLLRWAISRKSLFRIPVAIGADVLLAALLACSSLYAGLLFTENQLGWRQVTSVFVALSPDASEFEIGPCFWAMHTTFLPTLLYMSLILLCWLEKALLIPVRCVRWWLGKGQAHDNPLKLSAALCTLVSVTLVCLAMLIK